MWFQKISIPPYGESLEILRGRGFSRAKIYKEKYEPQLEIPGEREGSNKKNLPWGEVWIFSGTTQWLPDILCGGFV